MYSLIRFAVCLLPVVLVCRGEFSSAVGKISIPRKQGVGQIRITGLPFKPAALLFWYNDQAVTGQISAAFTAGFGAAVSPTNRLSVFARKENGGANARGRHANDACISIVNSAGATTFVADCISLNTDGFTLNLKKVAGVDLYINYLALGGDEILANIVQFNSRTAPGVGAVTGMGFQPDSLIILTAGKTEAIGDSSANYTHLGFGFVDTTLNQAGGGLSTKSTSSSHQRSQSLSKAIYVADTTAMWLAGQVTEFTGDGFRVDWQTVQKNGVKLWAIGLKGVRGFVSSVAAPVKNGAQSITSPGYRPSALLMGSFCGDAESRQANATLSFGGATSLSARGNIAASALAAPKTANSRAQQANWSNKLISCYTAGTSATLDAQADFGAFSDTGFGLNWNKTDITSRRSIFMALGPIGPAPEPPLPPVVNAPLNGANRVSTGVSLAWYEATGATSYDVYFGTTNDPPSVASVTGLTYSPGTLAQGTRYFWKVVAKNSGGSAASELSSFTTVGAVIEPGSPINPFPAAGSEDVEVAPLLTWRGGTRAISHDVYISTSNPPAGPPANVGGASYSPGTLSASTTYYWKVVAKNTAGATSSEVWSFTTGSGTTEPGAPSNPSPTVGSDDVHLAPVLAWTAGNRATSHDVYVGTTDPPSGPQANVAGTSYSPGALAPGTTYYWRVVAKNTSGSASSPVWSFTTELSPPSSPTDPVPVSGLEEVTLNPTLTWFGATGATTFDVYFGTANPPAGPPAKVASASYGPGTLIENTTYYWRVVAKNNGGSASSPVWSFTTGVAKPGEPSNPSPGSGTEGVELNPTLNWTAGRGAESHDVYFGTANPPSGSPENVTGVSFSPGALSEDTTYYWKVVAKNSAGTTASAIWSFTTLTPAPGKPANPIPAAGSSDIELTPTLKWTGGRDADFHEIYVGEVNPPSGSPVEVDGTTYTLGALSEDTTYYWRVVAKNGAGSASSPVWSFTTVSGETEPEAPSNPSPASGRTGVALSPALSWSAGRGATSHEVYFGAVNPPAGTPVIANSNRYSPGQLEADTTYYWKVVARNDSGSTSSPVWSFTTGSGDNNEPGAPTTPSPATGSTGTTLNPVLTWTAGSGADTHEVYFGAENPPSGTPVTVHGTSFDPGPLEEDTTYYWKVIARNEAGTASSAIWSFTTETGVSEPDRPEDPTPGTATTNVELTPTLTWNSGSGADSYDVYFGTDNPPAGPPIETSDTNYSPGTLTPNTIYHWKVIARNVAGSTSSAVWSFKTQVSTHLEKIYVDGVNGDDSNSGVKDSPFKTINKAAQFAGPGDTVIVMPGVYREWVHPANSGADSAPIVYRSQVRWGAVIKGSEEVPTAWSQAGSNVWKTVIPNSFFNKNSDWMNPFSKRHCCYSEENPIFLQYGQTITRGQVYMNDQPLEQALAVELTVDPDANPTPGESQHVAKKPMSWTSCVGTTHPGGRSCPEGTPGNTTIWVNVCPTTAACSVNPNQRLMEMNVRRAVWDPALSNQDEDTPDLDPRPQQINYLTIDGFDMRHAAARWSSIKGAYWQRGMISTNWSHSWEILNNHISDSTGTCLVSGSPPESFFGEWYKGWGMNGAEFHTGNHLVRNNIIERCYMHGIGGNRGWVGSRIERNLIQHINTSRLLGGWETAGIKIHNAVDVTIASNVIRNVRGRASGSLVHPCIWLDTGFQGSRITRNIIYDCDDQMIRLEAGHGPTLVDNNVIVKTRDGDQMSRGSRRALDLYGQQSIYVHNLMWNAAWNVYEADHCSPPFLPHSTVQNVYCRQIPHVDQSWAANNIFVKTGTKGFLNPSVSGAWTSTVNKCGDGCAFPVRPAHPTEFTLNWNVYWDGALPAIWSGADVQSRSSMHNPGLVITDLGSSQSLAGARVNFCSDALPQQIAAPRISGDSSKAGDGGFVPANTISSQTIETQLGAKITINTDILGNPRNSTTVTPGPLETLDTTSGSCAQKNTIEIRITN